MSPEIPLASMQALCGCEWEIHTAVQCKSFSYSEFLVSEELKSLTERTGNKKGWTVGLLSC